MRFPLPIYNPVKECNSCIQQEEKEVSAHILAYQVANQLIKNHSGTMTMDSNTLVINLRSLEEPLTINLHSGQLSYQSLGVPLQQHYASGKRLTQIVSEIQDYLAIPEANQTSDYELYSLLTKLVEIYHARCGLQIITLDNSEEKTTWELRLTDQGPAGWIYSDGTAKNRFGEVLELKNWEHLRPEKMAAYVFGFNRYCSNYPSPLKESLSN
ncbi:hypothetical protein [Desulfitobacterium metallireducens]|uniref:Uncharacterized protein n=1 Tax=Desulfitobacterium metallireducens DSM 15288 TaxID=871968 RepID=W0E797_9FIRM|nr:hypothetical protein [Desulfitobacterium metallireducens]AHF06720.1 hypothetical protein DESME_06345 [Desulfitobacterium metallireducens DSM 15288]